MNLRLLNCRHINGSISNGTYYSGRENGIPGGFGDTLSVLDRKSVSYSMYIVCDGKRHPVVKNGRGGSNTVTASVTVALNDNDRLEDGTKLVDAPTYPCTNADGDSLFYNSVEVRLIAWRT